jgi:hypothetical protein
MVLLQPTVQRYKEGGAAFSAFQRNAYTNISPKTVSSHTRANNNKSCKSPSSLVAHHLGTCAEAI